jgi:GNAT superfamily N-acetyltransferase
VIRQLGREESSSIGDPLFNLLGVASLEWLYYLETAKDRIAVYSSDSPRDYMVTLDDASVLIVTNSQSILQDFLNRLNAEKSYAFRCPEWMSRVVMQRFPPGESGSRGVVLVTCSTSEGDFKRYGDSRHAVRVLGDDDSDEVIASSGQHWSPEFIRGRIRARAFYGVQQEGRLVSWVGTIWESTRACEIGFAFTDELQRGKGMMKTLTSILTEDVLGKGKTPLLHTVETNAPALRLAESLGYRPTSREWAYFYTP